MSSLIEVQTYCAMRAPEHPFQPTDPSRDLVAETARRLAVTNLMGLLRDMVPEDARERVEAELERLFADPSDDTEASLARLRFIRDLALVLG